ncbi:MAG: LysR family transcriptional regulator [Verrucomicrobiae bacterium]|nr:LysR family transcriptional regulator [Verrucomicrobiae bacterium]
MFARLLAQSGLSLDRLRALVEVGACGSIVGAAEGDPARQSQYSRQLKELEQFFGAALVERHGKHVRLTSQGRELARISRFFLLGLSNFQRGCLAEGQTYRIGASATFISTFLLKVLAAPGITETGIRFKIEAVSDNDIERRLHELTLDFGVVTRDTLSRPLRTAVLGRSALRLWVPRKLYRSETQVRRALEKRTLPLALAVNELPPAALEHLQEGAIALACESFVEAQIALQEQVMAAIIPDFLKPAGGPGPFLQGRVPTLKSLPMQYCLAWNPRLLRLNPHAARRRDALISGLGAKLKTT